MTLITSFDNKLFKTFASLQTAKGIERHGLALVSGRRIVPELLAERGGGGATVLVREDLVESPLPLREGDRGRGRTIGALASPSPSAARFAPPVEGGASNIVVLARPLFETLDEFGTGAPLLVLPVPVIGTYTEESQDAALTNAPAGLALATAAQDPANLGAILRSAAAFDVGQVVLLAECAHPFLPRVTRAAAGANFRLPLLRGPSIKSLGPGWIALDIEGEAIDSYAFPKDARLLLGEEGLGIPQSFTGKRIRIPISPKAESLNVAVAAGIALAAFRRQWRLG